MAIFELQGPDGQVYEVDAPDEASALQAFQGMNNTASPSQQPESGYGSQIFSGLLEGATGALGAPVDLVNNLLVAPAAAGINYAFGTDIQPSQTPLGGSAGLRQGLAISPESDSGGEKFARRVAQSVGGAAPFAAGANSAGQVASILATGLGGGVGGATAQQIAPDNIGAEIAGELIGGLGTGAAISGLANRSARQAAEKAVPSIDDLKAQASDLYAQAEARGVVADPAMTTSLADDITKIARDNELITPTGRIAEAYPKAREALQLMRDYAGYDMNPTQMQVIRETLADAAFGTDGKEGRIAKKMLSAFDDFVSPLAPELAEARKVSSRYLKAGTLERARELAGARAGQFTGSGFENALRTEYRNLDRRIIKGQEQGWSPEQIQAIQNVSRGTPVQNTARNIGKLAPTGVVSAGLGSGVPFMIGNAVGGPGLGAASAAATMGAGFAGREAATRMGLRNAEIAELLARSGGALPNSSNPAITEAVIQALIGSQLAAQSNMGNN